MSDMPSGEPGQPQVERRLGVFAKHWTPGRVKTRLAAALGNEAAAGVHRAALECLLQRLSQVDADCWLAFSPEDRGGDFQNLLMELGLGDRWRLAPQCAGDLGQRMQSFFAEGFLGGAEQVVLLGSDSPNLPLEMVCQAFRELDHASVVLGPADDGGYYLLGAVAPVPPVFSDLPFSTSDLWAATLARLSSHNLPHVALPVWYDVDDLASFRRLLADLDQETPPPGDPLHALRQRLLAFS